MVDRHTGVTPVADGAIADERPDSMDGAGLRVECAPERPVCGIRDILDRIGDTWSVLVVIQLRLYETRRFGQLLRSVDGISQRMLTVTLRRLQRDGLITRTVLDTSPPQVEYALTEVGLSLTVILRELVDWAAANREDIDAARRRWDVETNVR